MSCEIAFLRRKTQTIGASNVMATGRSDVYYTSVFDGNRLEFEQVERFAASAFQQADAKIIHASIRQTSLLLIADAHLAS